MLEAAAEVAEAADAAEVAEAADAADAVVEASSSRVETSEGAAAEARDLSLLEIQVWLELDDLLNLIRSLSAEAMQRVPVPSQMLGLLPPPPPNGGWPESFRLAEISSQLDDRYAALTKPSAERPDEGSDALMRALAYVPVDEDYPVRRRAERLSWVVWTVIGGQSVGVNVRER